MGWHGPWKIAQKCSHFQTQFNGGKHCRYTAEACRYIHEPCADYAEFAALWKSDDWTPRSQGSPYTPRDPKGKGGKGKDSKGKGKDKNKGKQYDGSPLPSPRGAGAARDAAFVASLDFNQICKAGYECPGYKADPQTCSKLHLDPNQTNYHINAGKAARKAAVAQQTGQQG